MLLEQHPRVAVCWIHDLEGGGSWLLSPAAINGPRLHDYPSGCFWRGIGQDVEMPLQNLDNRDVWPTVGGIEGKPLFLEDQ